MFILNNYTEDAPFRITRKNNVISLENRCDGIAHRSTEARQPVQYFCRKRSEGSEGAERSIHTGSLIPAKMLCVETIYEKEAPVQQETTYDLLVNEFGDKSARDRIKRREVGAATRAQSMQVNVGNQILPDFNRDTDDVREIYKLELLLGEEALRSFSQASVEPEDLCPLLEKYQASAGSRTALAAADCLYKILTVRNTRDLSIPEAYRAFYSEVRGDVIRGRLPPLLRDKLIMKLYVLLLMINDYTIHYNDIPMFEAPRQKVTGMLKMLGCSVSSNGVVALTKPPQETFSVR